MVGQHVRNLCFFSFGDVRERIWKATAKNSFCRFFCLFFKLKRHTDLFEIIALEPLLGKWSGGCEVSWSHVFSGLSGPGLRQQVP